MYGRAELKSLETGVVSPDWTRAWNMISSIVGSETLIAGLDLTRDFAFDADRRRRIEQNALYLTLDIADAELKVNAVGVPYGKSAVGWHALQDRDNTASLLAAQLRWSELGELADDFRLAAEGTYKVQEVAQLDAIRQLIERLKEGLDGALANTTQAAKTLAEASKLNTATQQDVLTEFQTGYDRLFELNAQHLQQSFKLWGCRLSDDDNCLQTIRNTIDQMEEDCEPETGLDWLKPIVDLITDKVPVLKMIETALESGTGGKGYVESMEALLLAATPGGLTPQAPPVGDAVNVLAAEKTFADLERYFDASAAFSTAIRSMVERSSSQCSAGGLPLQRFEQFKMNLIDFDDTIQDYANQIRLTHAQITSTLGMISYLTSEGAAYETLEATNAALSTRLNENTGVLLDKLHDGAIPYENIATEQRTFLVNACQHVVAATKTSQADLTLISQALQTSTGRPDTQPHLVVPAKPMYMLDTGNPVQEELEFDREYGFHISAWDASAFRARFSGAGVPSAPSFMSEAVKRFELLMNTQVCSTDDIKPPVQFVVRKVITGQALKTLVHGGKVDFSVSLDDVVRGGNGGGQGASVTARYARDLSTDQLSLELGSPFVVHAGYSVCNGVPGDECANGHRLPIGSAGTVADGKLGKVSLATRGRSYTAIGNHPDCDGGAEPTVSNVPLMRDGAPEPISSCLTPQTSPRVSSRLSYFTDADATDPLLLGAHMSDAQCLITGVALAARPLQGLPVLGTWALTTNDVIARAMSNTTAPAEISDDVLADISGGVTGLEVLFLVAAEPVETSEVGGYGSPDGSTQSSTAYASASLSEDAETVFFEAFDPTPGSSVVGIHAVVYVGGTASAAQFVPGAQGSLSVDPAFSRIEYWAEDSAGNEQARQTLHKYPTTILADAPVAYYRLGESAGELTALDESVNARHGTYRGRYEDSFPPRLGKPGAISFDPDTSAEFFWSNNYNHSPPTQWTFVEIPHHSSQVPPARELTLEAWFTLMPGASHQTYSAIVAKGATNGADGYGLMYYGYKLWFFVNHYNNRIGIPLPASGIYHHIVATLNGQEARIYLNGSLAASGTLYVPAINAQAGALNIGKWWLGSWLGMIDEVAVYHDALDERQVTNHYRAGKGLAPLAP